MIEIKNLSKWYDKFQVLSECSTSVAKGDVMVICGPSGSGKSTLIKTVNGLEPFQQGEVLVDGVSVGEPKTDLRALRARIGMVFQNFELFPHLSVRENLTLAQIKVLGRSSEEATARGLQYLDRVGLLAQQDKFPSQLSGGQQQRVAIARAIVVEPPLVLMDEPLSNLDAKLRLEMRAEIRRIHTMLGCSTIYVTHDQEEALSLADRILVMIDGQTRQIGTPEQLYARPAHADVAEFMGYRNLFRCRAETAIDGVAVTIGAARLQGTPMDAVGGDAVAAIRPDDLRPQSDGPIAATVEIAEYHGRDFYAVARGSDGTELYFRSPMRVNPGEPVRLAASRDRVLVYAT